MENLQQNRSAKVGPKDQPAANHGPQDDRTDNTDPNDQVNRDIETARKAEEAAEASDKR